MGELRRWGALFQSRWLTGCFLACAIALLVYTSTIKHRGKNIWDYDTQFWYTAGTCWWNGESPYNSENFTRTWIALYRDPPRDQATFVYPPTMAVICLPLAILPWETAAWTFRVINLLAVVGGCLLIARLTSNSLERHPLLGRAGWYAGACALLGSISQAIFQGQCSPVVVLGCVATWYGFQRRVLWIFLLGFVIASIKPQISMIPLFYILFSGGMRWFSYGAILSAGLSVLTLLAVPAPSFFAAFHRSMDHHLTYQYFNSWDWYSSVPALLGATPLGKHFMILGLALGIVGALWIARRQQVMEDTLLNRVRHQQLVWIVAMAAMPIHIYDLAGQVFIITTLWAIPGWSRRALVIVCMYLGNKAFTVAYYLGAAGAPPYIATLVQAQWMSAASLVLLVSFCYWYVRDFRSEESTLAHPNDGVV